MEPAAPQERSTLEGLFPPGWDPALDVLVVVGRSEPGFWDALREWGQARAIEVAPGGTTDPVPPPPYQRAADAIGLFRAVLSFPGPPPANATFRRQPGAELPTEMLEGFTAALRKAVASHAVYQRTVDRHAPVWAEQGIANLARVAELPSVSALRGAFAGKPCVIVSPGPSLERNAGLLREVSGRALLLTCSHAVRAIEAAGVMPDIVAVSDPKSPRRHFEGCDASAPSAYVLDAVVHADCFELPARRIFTFATHPAIDAWIFGAVADSAHLDSGGSVACAELSLALAMGCDPIVFVGQDLAFTGGRYYAASSVDASSRTVVTGNDVERILTVVDPGTGETKEVSEPLEPALEVPGWGGGTVTTSLTLDTFRQWFEVAAQAAPVRVYNCTEGGARIGGMEHVTLREVIDRHDFDELDAAAVLDRAAARVDTAARREAMRAAVVGMLAGLEECVGRARECSRLATRASRDARALDELGRAERRLSDAIGPLAFLSMMSQSRIRAAQEQAARAESLEQNLAAAEQLFAVIGEAGRKLVEPLRRSLDALSD